VEGRGSDLTYYLALAWEDQGKPKISEDSRSSDPQSNLEPSGFKTKMSSLYRDIRFKTYENVHSTWIVGYLYGATTPSGPGPPRY
jgi:hypothetical protein